MNNKIVSRCCTRIFVRRGFATLRFNFRGVGRAMHVHNGIGRTERRGERRSTGSR